jgi:hypothetical protein
MKFKKVGKRKVRVRPFPANGTIGALVIPLIHEGKDDQEVIKIVLEKFPGNDAFNKAHVSWYRYQIKIGSYPACAE